MKKTTLATALMVLFLASTATMGVAAALYPTGYTLEQTPTGFATLSNDQWHSFNTAVKMGTVDTDDRAQIAFSGGPTLSNINALSYWTYTVQA